MAGEIIKSLFRDIVRLKDLSDILDDCIRVGGAEDFGFFAVGKVRSTIDVSVD